MKPQLYLTVHHDQGQCSIHGGRLADDNGQPRILGSVVGVVNGDYTIHAQKGDAIIFKLESCDPNVTFDDPPLIWTYPERCQAMTVTRTSGTEFRVLDSGSDGGQFDFKLDIDKVTVTGRVHCKDDPSILNDNP